MSALIKTPLEKVGNHDGLVEAECHVYQQGFSDGGRFGMRLR